MRLPSRSLVVVVAFVAVAWAAHVGIQAKAGAAQVNAVAQDRKPPGKPTPTPTPNATAAPTPIPTPTPTPIASGPTPTPPASGCVYVDAIAGNDANPGTSAAPLRTLSRADALVGSGGCLQLARGSVFREQFLLHDNVHVSAYGSGAKPVVSGADLVPNSQFSLAPGAAHTFRVSLPSIAQTYNPYAAVWNSDVLMAWDANVRLGGRFQNNQTSVAGVDATRGSFYWDSAAKMLYVHPFDDSDPRSNGRVYEVSVRTLAVHGGNGVLVEDVVGEKAYAQSRTGQQGYGILGYGAGTYRRCIGRFSWNHSVGVANSLNAGDLIFEDCQAEDAEPVITDPAPATLFVGFRDGTAVSRVIFRRCVARQPNTSNNVKGFYAHGGSVDAVAEDCGAENLAYGAEFDNTTSKLREAGSFTAKNCKVGVRTYLSLSNLVIAGAASYGIDVQASNLTFSSCRIVDSAIAVPLYNRSGTCTVTNSTIAWSKPSTTNAAQLALAVNNSAKFVVSGCTFQNAGAAYQGAGQLPVLTSDSNDFFSLVRVASDSPGTYVTLADWQAASGQDLHSTTADPGLGSSFFVVTVGNPAGT